MLVTMLNELLQKKKHYLPDRFSRFPRQQQFYVDNFGQAWGIHRDALQTNSHCRAQMNPIIIGDDIITAWWFGTWILWLSIQLGMSSSQLTNSIIFQRGRLNHQPDYIHYPIVSSQYLHFPHISPEIHLHLLSFSLQGSCWVGFSFWENN